MPGREVTLVLCTADRELLGAAPEFPVVNGWWRDVEDVVATGRALLGVDLRVLRILRMPADSGLPSGGHVAYLAEVDAAPRGVALRRWPGDPLAPHPNRLDYAQPGGHSRDLDWAATVLAHRDLAQTAPPVQVRTWNLSSIWRLTTTSGTVWLKATPPFCAAEAAVMPLLDPDVVPAVLGAAPQRVLLADVPGRDQYEARGEELRAMVRMLVGLQAGWSHRVPELEGLGVIDKRADAALPQLHAVVDRNRHELDDATRRAIDELVDGLPRRFSELAACGLPDTLVHGDFHPGNVRGTPGRYRILDWGDCGLGNPMLDLRPSFEHFTPADQRGAIEAWSREWARALPGCDPQRAAELVRPLGPLYGAVTYQAFLDGIEPDVRPYHEGDPASALRAAIAPGDPSL